MNFLEEQKKYNLPTDTKYSKSKPFRWPGGVIEAIDLLGNIPYFSDSNELFNVFPVNESLMSVFENWSLEDLANSALFFYLENIVIERQRRDNPVIK